MMWIQAERFLKLLHGIRDAAVARGEDAEVIPGVRERLRIVGLLLQAALKHLARGCIFVLIQIDAAYAVEGLGAGGIVAQSLLKCGFRRVEIPALKKQRAKRKIISPECESVACAGEGQTL